MSDFDNYISVLTSTEFWQSIYVTVIYVMVTVPIELVLGFLAAWLVNWARRVARLPDDIIGSPLFTLEVAIGYLGVTFFTDQGGLIAVPPRRADPCALDVDRIRRNCRRIFSTWRWTSFIFIIVLAGLAGIPSDLYDAAVLDAKNHWQVMWHLAIPLAWPVTTIAVLLRTVECLKVFAIPFALTSGGPGTSTQTFSAMDYLTTIQFFDFGKGSAMGIIFLILVSVVIAVFFQQMRKRLT